MCRGFTIPRSVHKRGEGSLGTDLGTVNITLNFARNNIKKRPRGVNLGNKQFEGHTYVLLLKEQVRIKRYEGYL